MLLQFTIEPELMGESLFPGTDSLHAHVTPPRTGRLFLNPSIGLYLEGMVPSAQRTL